MSESHRHIVICGHGPSLLGKRLGEYIDGFDTVIRQKRCHELLKNPADYGTRTDIVCGSYTIAQMLPGSMPGCTYWAFLDSRHHSVTPERLAEVCASVPCLADHEFCNHWNEVFRRMRTEFDRDKRQESKPNSDDLGIASMSSGLHTLLYAVHFLRPETIHLAGFDNVKSGGFTWSVTHGPDYQKYPDHNWEAERQMVPGIAEHYGVGIEYL